MIPCTVFRRKDDNQVRQGSRQQPFGTCGAMREGYQRKGDTPDPQGTQGGPSRDPDEDAGR